MTPGEQISRAEQAHRILTDPLVVEALETLKTAVRDGFFETPADNIQQREFLHLMDKARQQFVSIFTIIINDGELAKASLADEAYQSTRANIYRGRHGKS